MRTLITIIIIFHSFISHGQLYDAQWALGYNESVVDFRSSDSVHIYSIPTFEYFTSTNASICDSSGNLLYYTNGVNICGINGILPNGSGLNPCTYTDNNASVGLDIDQAALFIPKPGSARYYYLFHFSNDNNDSTRPETLYYSLIDKEGNGGLGNVIAKNIPILHGVLLREGGLTACKHANGRDYWIVMGAFVSNTFYKFLLTADSILGPYTQSIGPQFPYPYDWAYSNFSLDGSKYATGIVGGSPILLMDFDRCNGEFSNPITLNELAGAFINQDSILGCESLAFSPSGEFLYVSNPYNLDQFDLWSANEQDSIQLYHGNYTDTGAQYYGINMLQLAPNGKLYASTWNGGLEALHFVTYPDLKGDSAKFLYAVQPTLTIASNNLPNLINYKLGPLIGSGCDTITGITELSSASQLKTMPNPADEYVYVDIGKQGNYEFELFSLNGQLLSTKQTKQIDIFDTESLANGVYFIKVIDKNTGNEIAVRKLAVTH